MSALKGRAIGMRETRNAYKIFVRNPEGKKPLDLRETGWKGVEWINVHQDRDQGRVLENTVVNLRFP
jgi:hypothetical protein